MAFECDFSIAEAQLRLIEINPLKSALDFKNHWRALCQSQEPLEHGHTPTGRPFLFSHHEDISISHTEEARDRKVYLLGRAQSPARLGVDIENKNRKISPVLRERLISINPTAAPILTWVLIEALCKCLDQPLRIGSFSISEGRSVGEWQTWSYQFRDVNAFTDVLTQGWTTTMKDHVVGVAIGKKQII